ncbi:MAG: hypothetical protein DDT25_00091 [Chloroflexi bacterium]|nr:hypothetical protein [Chloroflexota bacterium]
MMVVTGWLNPWVCNYWIPIFLSGVRGRFSSRFEFKRKEKND